MKMIDFTCPSCDEPVKLVSRHTGRILPCPNCGSRVFWPPPDVLNPPKRTKLIVSVAVLTTLLVLWVLTMLMGPGSIAKDEKKAVAMVQRNFRNTSVYINAPLPFLLGLKVDGSSPKLGGRHTYTVQKYYMWFFGYTKEIPGSSISALIKKLSISEKFEKR